MYILQRKIPIDCGVVFILVDLFGNLRKFPVSDVAAVADDAGKENLLGWPGSLVLDLLMLKFVEKMGGMIYCRQHFKHGNIFPFREEGSKRQAFHLFLFRRPQ